MFLFGSAEADRAFAMDFGILAAITGAIFFALVWLAEVVERAAKARRRMRKW